MTKTRIWFIVLVLLVWLSQTGSQSIPQQTIKPIQKPLFSVYLSVPAAPDPFEKQLPTNGAINQPNNDLKLQWGASSSGVAYEYCLRTNKKSCPPPKWVSVGANTSVILQGLSPSTTYYWQVRAVDASNNYTYADNDVWWQFSTIQNADLPGPFNKLTPSDDQTNQPVTGLVMTWSASDRATSYQYCFDMLNNNACDTSWASVTGLTVTVSGLSTGTTYYWQVRAVNASGSVQADFGTWFSFHTKPSPPGVFSKISPANYAVGQLLNLTLTWGASSGSGTTYEYCIGIAPCTAASTWTSVGTNLSANPSNLQYGTTYYWQVRAVNATATTYANSGASWSFSTQIGPPQNFGKTGPGNNLSDEALSLNLTWGTSQGTNIHYEYCIDTTGCTPASTWFLAGLNTQVNISGLAYATTYFWQVRAVNVAGTTYADGGTVWQFTTQTEPPQTFTKLSPPETGLDKVPPNLTLQWSSSAGADRYFYCVDTVSHPDNDLACGTGYVLNNTTESNHLSLAYNQTYYWQVYAQNGEGDISADDGVWWSFTTIASQPPSFTKISPVDEGIDQPLNPWLYWWTPGAPETTYQYCIDAASDCPSDIWSDVAENEPIHIINPLSHDTQYFWQVRASNSGGTTYANDAWWSFTTLKEPPSSSDQTFNTDEDTPLTETLAALSNYDKHFALYGSLPAGLLNFHSDGDFTYKPDAYFNGSITFQFVVSDGFNPPVGPYTVTITVNPVNNPPELNQIPDQVVENGKQETFWAVATDPDLPYGDHLTYSIDEALPSGASISSETGFFNWVVPANQGSEVFTFTVRVTDIEGLSASQKVKITVNAHLGLYLPIMLR